MQCPTKSLMIICVGLSLSSCAREPPLDSFCTLYSRVIVNKGDAEIKAKREVKERIAVNEGLSRECPPK